MNIPVSFEIAKLLKEKQIIFKTDEYYSSETEVTSKSYNEYPAPTIAEVVMWLYEKHKFWTEVTTDINGKFCFPWLEGKYNSPTEAYSAAIEYTLKNLIP